MLHSALHPGFSALAGTGIIAVRDIAKGTVLWGPCPRCRTWGAAEQRNMPPTVVDWLDEYGYRLADRSLILPCQGAHLLNHSCDAAALDHGLVGGIAVRDIRAGDEVTCDYRTFRYDEPWEFSCSCGSAECTGRVHSIATSLSADPPPETPEELVRWWRRRMTPALSAAQTLPQEIPLKRGSVVEARESTAA